MNYNFDSELAVKHGVNEAIFIHNLFFWITQNEANRKHFNKGRYWTYNTKNAFVELFPFWTYWQVKKIIKNLSENGIILTDNFNENTWDRTTWFALCDDVINYYKNTSKPSKTALGKKTQSSRHIYPIDVAKKPNRVGIFTQSLIGTDNKPYNKQQIEGSLSFFEKEFPTAFETLMMQYKTRIKDFVKFSELFEATVQQERLEFDVNVLSGRFKKFARNWIDNQDKFEGVIQLNAGSSNKVSGGF